jgi:hypothetical protein
MKRFLTIVLSILLTVSCIPTKKVVYLPIIENGEIIGMDTIIVKTLSKKEKKLKPKFK